MACSANYQAQQLGQSCDRIASCPGVCVCACLCVAHSLPEPLLWHFRDSVIYSANCSKLKDQMVAIKMYNKAKLSPSKMRAIKREAAMMIYMTRKRWGCIAMIRDALNAVVSSCAILAPALQW